jgi:hypothetical protein
MKAFLTIATALTALLAVGWTFFPASMLSAWSVQGDATALYVGRRCGVLLSGYTLLLWLIRAAPASEARSAVLASGIAVTSLMAVVSFLGVVMGTIGAGAWGAVVVEALLAAGFAHFYFASR